MKRGETKTDVKSAGDAGAANVVLVRANPKLFRGCQGQVVVNVDGVTRVVTTAGLSVDAATADKMTAVEVRGVAACVLG